MESFDQETKKVWIWRTDKDWPDNCFFLNSSKIQFEKNRIVQTIIVDKRFLIFVGIGTAAAKFRPTSVYLGREVKQKLDNMTKGLLSDHKNITNLSSYVLGKFLFY
jgi:hypothetical protein